jgi:hypothetical protein
MMPTCSFRYLENILFPPPNLSVLFRKQQLMERVKARFDDPRPETELRHQLGPGNVPGSVTKPELAFLRMMGVFAESTVAGRPSQPRGYNN